jgi:hypothetical protein
MNRCVTRETQYTHTKLSQVMTGGAVKYLHAVVGASCECVSADSEKIKCFG